MAMRFCMSLAFLPEILKFSGLIGEMGGYRRQQF
jgi:hypothetical protein